MIGVNLSGTSSAYALCDARRLMSGDRRYNVIELLSGLPDNAVGFEFSGSVSQADYERVLIPAIEATLAGNDRVDLLCHIGPDFDNYELGAIWEDAKVGLQHVAVWQRIALVTDVEWIRIAVKVFGFTIPAEIRLFDNGQLAEARAWIAG
jgi:hypothetical protein